MLLRVVEWLDAVMVALLAQAGKARDRAALLAERLRVLLPVYNSVHSGLGRLNSYAGVAAPIVYRGAGRWSRRVLSARAPIHPALRNFVSDVHGTLLRVFAYACAVGAICLVGTELYSASWAVTAAEPAPQRDWIDIGKPFPAFALSFSEFEDAPRYAIRRHRTGGGRKDVITFGNLEAPGAAAEVEIYRAGTELDVAAERDEAVAVGTAELRLTGRPAAVKTIETKFGPATVSEFMERNDTRRCLRFTRDFDDPRLIISGWYCSAGLEIVDPSVVTCALDRLTLLAAGSEPKTGALFARAELNRSFCGQKGIILAATPKRGGDWIEAARDPKLRGRK